MPKTQMDRASGGQAGRATPPPLNAAVRRHLGMTLRTFYAQTLSEPLGDRIETLLSRLQRPKG